MTTRKKYLAIAGASVASLAMAMSPLLPAQAATVSEWGVWSSPSTSSGDGNGTFAYLDSKFIGATYDYTDTTSIEALNSDDGSWFEADTPIGAVFGPSGPFATANRLEIYGDPVVNPVLTVTFDSAVPAGQLGFAVNDIDDDQVTITATDASGNALTGDQINGTATTQAFNFCDVATPPADCSGDTDVPDITTNASSVVAIGNTPGGSDGATAWFMPSAAVKSISFEIEIYGSPGDQGHHDFWIAEQYTTSLPDTGIDSSTTAWIIGVGVSLLVAGGLMVARRRA